jgi:hypothetical protein
MKKTYEAPSVEVVKFQYSDQVVAASSCVTQITHVGDGRCTSSGGTEFQHN